MTLLTVAVKDSFWPDWPARLIFDKLCLSSVFQFSWSGSKNCHQLVHLAGALDNAWQNPSFFILGEMMVILAEEKLQKQQKVHLQFVFIIHAITWLERSPRTLQESFFKSFFLCLYTHRVSSQMHLLSKKIHQIKLKSLKITSRRTESYQPG